MAFLRFFGKLLISAGMGVLLFVLWTLYGTGIYTSQQQSALADEFNSQADFPNKVGKDDPDIPNNLEIQGPPKEFDPGPAEPVFRIEIPKIDVDSIVVEGVGDEELKNGPGHYPKCDEDFGQPYCTDFPESYPGEKGRVIVSGHRTTYGAPFGDLDEMQPGDEIITETRWGTYRYVVTEQKIVDDQDVTVTVQVHSKRELVLTTCHPKFSAAQRLVIFAELEERIE